MMTAELVPAVPPNAFAKTERVRPPDPVLTEILGPPPILPSEDAGAYQALRESVRAAVAPSDVIEELWVRDVVDLMWEALRLRRLKAKLMTVATPRALSIVLGGLMVDGRRRDLLDGLAAGHRRARKEIDRALIEAGLDQAAVEAVALSESLDEVERIDHMIMQVEARRHGALREVDRRRDATARQLRRMAAECEAADIAEIAPPDDVAVA